jgi:hypothetical protein
VERAKVTCGGRNLAVPRSGTSSTLGRSDGGNHIPQKRSADHGRRGLLTMRPMLHLIGRVGRTIDNWRVLASRETAVDQL